MATQDDPVSTETPASPATGTGATQEQLTQLIAKATALSGVKDYTAAAEVYSQATELQAELNGEMNVENADLYYAYGRCLFFVAQKTSTVLGGTAAGAQLSTSSEKKPSKKRTANGSHKIDTPEQKTSEQNGQSSADGKMTASASDSAQQDKPLFQFTGDENFEVSDEEDEEGDGEEEEDDDFETSFEFLDLARVLYARKLEALRQAEDPTNGDSKASADDSQSSSEHILMSRIADIYDLQSEISLEGEKFQAAVVDLKSCLALKQKLEAPESSLLAECHYKLSLALEVAAQDQARDADGNPTGDITINWDLRNEAVQHQEKAIESCELRVTKETEKMKALSDDKEIEKAKLQIEDVQDMIGEMKVRLAELRKPPVNVKAETEGELNKEMMAGVLGQIMGAAGKTKEEQKEELAKVIAGATDLSGMVVKRKKPKPASSLSTANDETASNASGSISGSKRKLDSVEETETEADTINGKKARVEDEVEDAV